MPTNAEQVRGYQFKHGFGPPSGVTPAWTREDIENLGRDPEPSEYSPGKKELNQQQVADSLKGRLADARNRFYKQGEYAPAGNLKKGGELFPAHHSFKSQAEALDKDDPEWLDRAMTEDSAWLSSPHADKALKEFGDAYNRTHEWHLKPDDTPMLDGWNSVYARILEPGTQVLNRIADPDTPLGWWVTQGPPVLSNLGSHILDNRHSGRDDGFSDAASQAQQYSDLSWYNTPSPRIEVPPEDVAGLSGDEKASLYNDILGYGQEGQRRHSGSDARDALRSLSPALYEKLRDTPYGIGVRGAAGGLSFLNGLLDMTTLPAAAGGLPGLAKEIMEEAVTDGGINAAMEFATPVADEPQSEFDKRRQQEFAERDAAIRLAPELAGLVKPTQNYWQRFISEPIDRAGRSIGESFQRGVDANPYGGF